MIALAVLDLVAFAVGLGIAASTPPSCGRRVGRSTLKAAGAIRRGPRRLGRPSLRMTRAEPSAQDLPLAAGGEYVARELRGRPGRSPARPNRRAAGRAQGRALLVYAAPATKATPAAILRRSLGGPACAVRSA